jgi:hypothetical protein
MRVSHGERRPYRLPSDELQVSCALSNCYLRETLEEVWDLHSQSYISLDQRYNERKEKNKL